MNELLPNIETNLVDTVESDIRLIRPSFLFDADWYLQRYGEVATLGLDAVSHYCTTGWWQGYLPSPNFAPDQIDAPEGRNPLAYALENLQLGRLHEVRHFCPEPSFQTLGRGNATHSGPASVIQPADAEVPCRFSGALAVHLHLFHTEMAVDFRRLLGTIPVPFDLFVSVPEASKVIEAEVAFKEIANVRRVIAASFPNVGRDIGPMLAGFGRRLAPYDLVFHLHSKKSDHTPQKRDWAAQMGHDLLASRGHTTSLLELFESKSDLGLLFPAYHPSVQKQIRWGANFAACQRLMARMGVRLTDLDLAPFPAGSFFAIRGEVLRTLLAGEFSFADFGQEAGQIDGTFAHAIERMFPLICLQLDYRFQQIRALRPFSQASVITPYEPYRSTRLQAFRTEMKPSLPYSNPPGGLRVTFISGGVEAQPLPYEHLISDARYLFLQADAGEDGGRHAQWDICPLPTGDIGGGIARAMAGLTDCDLAIWVDPTIAIVDDISAHIGAVLSSGAAVGAFPHQHGVTFKHELDRLANRYSDCDIASAAKLLPDDLAVGRPLFDKGLVIVDRRHPASEELLARWRAIAEQLRDTPQAVGLAFDIACALEDVSPLQLSANGAGLRADPRLRHFGPHGVVHPYLDVMPRISEFVHEGTCTPTALQKAASALFVDLILLVSQGDSADLVAKTLQRLASLPDARRRCIIHRTDAGDAALDAVIASHLARSPLDVVTTSPASCLRGDLVMFCKPGTLLTEYTLQALAEAAREDSESEAFMPLFLSGMDESNEIWPSRLAAECRRAAHEMALDPQMSLLKGTSLPVLLRRTKADALLAVIDGQTERVLSETLKVMPCRLVWPALVFVSDNDIGILPDAALEFLERLSDRYHPANPAISSVAFYLPQFHTFEVNDRLWGAGFSEWRNVVKARPRFEGHHQPRLPGDLGYYDLRTAQTLREQGELAELHGLHGMAVYYYRFGEQRLMSEPTDLLLADGTIPLRFFYCWANEDWTRAWDGRSDDVNLKQDYSDKTLSLILADVIRACADTRYIRVNGKPVFMIYQLNKLPRPREMVEAIRNEVRDRLGIEICLGTTFNNEFKPEWEELVDFIAQFPPHRTPRRTDRVILRGDEKPAVFEPEREDFFESYSDVSGQAIEAVSMFDKLQPGICPDWDNSPRREHHAHILVGATPEQFGEWTNKASFATWAKQQAGQAKTGFLFVNAWNEWAEGAVLEPYEGDGRASLVAFSNNLRWSATSGIRRLEKRTREGI